MIRPIVLSVAIVSAGFLDPTLVSAQSDTVLFTDVPSADELNTVLFGTKSRQGQTRGLNTRAIRFHAVAETPTPAGATAPAAQRPVATAAVEPAAEPIAAVPTATPKGAALGFNIQFAFGSAELLDDSRPFLDRLGEVLSTPENAGKTVTVVGHTDAVGSAGYNMTLSQARADVVRSYLTSSWSVDPSRLQVVGVGESRPLPNLDPNDGLNRRVEFIAMR